MKSDELMKRVHSGQIYYYGGGPELAAPQLKRLDMVHQYNQLPPSHQEEKARLLRAMFAHIGRGCYIETPFHANWGGQYVSFGNHVYANFNLTLVDDTYITVGNNVMFGPNVVLCTGTHPVSPALRLRQAQYNLPVSIGDNVWIGANVSVLPGVTIGSNSVIGAGSIVTRDIPSGVVAAGCPCRVMREISPEDEAKWAGKLPEE